MAEILTDMKLTQTQIEKKTRFERLKATPVVLIDTREQCPLPITAYPVERTGLPVGDYGIKGFSDWENPRFIVERKSLADLCGSLSNDRERFMREIEKLRQFAFRAIVIEDSPKRS